MSDSDGNDPLDHPAPELLERFMRNEIAGAERRRVVRHLLGGCTRCAALTREIWVLGDPAARRRRQAAAPGAPAAPERHDTAAAGVPLEPAVLQDPEVLLEPAVLQDPGVLPEAGVPPEAAALPPKAAALPPKAAALPPEVAGAEAALFAAAAALARQGRGRQAVVAQVELGRALARSGRGDEMKRLGLDRRPPLFPRDASWEWTTALLVFQAQAHDAPDDTATLDALARYLATAPRPPAPQPAPVA